MTATMSKLTYAASVWAEFGTITAHNLAIFIRPRRQVALRSTRCYQMVSDTATLMLAVTPSADLLTRELSRVRNRAKENPRLQKKIKAEERYTIIEARKLRLTTENIN